MASSSSSSFPLSTTSTASSSAPKYCLQQFFSKQTPVPKLPQPQTSQFIKHHNECYMEDPIRPGQKPMYNLVVDQLQKGYVQGAQFWSLQDHYPSGIVPDRSSDFKCIEVAEMSEISPYSKWCPHKVLIALNKPMLPSWDNAIILEEWRGPSCSIQDITGWGGYFMTLMEKEKQFFGLKHIVPDPYEDHMFVPIFCMLSKVPHWFGEEIHIKAAFDERIDWDHLRKWTDPDVQIECVEENEPYLVEHTLLDSDVEHECRHDHPDHDDDSSCNHASCHLPQRIRTKKILVDESCFLWKEPRRPQMKMEDVKGWVTKGYKFVHLEQIDVLVKPHFKYELNAPYLISLLDVRHVDWKQALICQFTGELSKDGLCCVQPNFMLSLQDPHLLQAFVLCVQIKEVNLVAKSIYATITSRCTFNLLQSTVTSFKLDYGINFPLSMNKNIMQVGVEISNEGYLQGYPAIGEFLQRQKYKERKTWQSIISKYPEKHAHRQSQLQLQPTRSLSLPQVLPIVRTPSDETSSPNRDSAVKMMMMASPSAPKTEQGETCIPSYVTSGDWPPKMAYTTTTAEEMQKGTPEFRADVSYLLLHSAQSSKTQDDKTRQLNYLIHWSTYAEKHFRRIEEQLQIVQANMEAIQTLLKEEKKESKPEMCDGDDG
ncbi:hypothetical protein EJ110_NYTH60227 [Nymphaea thermarum]|nr:hypothetical protein EJ110_NYTH60227 [Nymphaea thermarum]